MGVASDATPTNDIRARREAAHARRRMAYGVIRPQLLDV